MQRLSKYIFYEITRKLSLKTTLRLSGVCKEFYRKIRYKNASGKYICLRVIDLRKDDTDAGDFVLLYLYENFYRACRNNKVKVVDILIKAGLCIDGYSKHWSKHYTPLWIACNYDAYEVAELLLKRGADANRIMGNRTTTPLLCAAKGHKEDIVDLILRRSRQNVDMNKENKDGITPLIYAASCGHKKLVKILLNFGADANYTNKDGLTAFSYYSCNYKYIQKVLKKSLNMNKKTKNVDKKRFIVQCNKNSSWPTEEELSQL